MFSTYAFLKMIFINAPYESRRNEAFSAKSKAWIDTVANGAQVFATK